MQEPIIPIKGLKVKPLPLKIPESKFGCNICHELFIRTDDEPKILDKKDYCSSCIIQAKKEHKFHTFGTAHGSTSEYMDSSPTIKQYGYIKNTGQNIANEFND